MITGDDLVRMGAEVTAACPEHTLVKNAVGNLAIMVDGDYVGWLDLNSGEVNLGGVLIAFPEETS